MMTKRMVNIHNTTYVVNIGDVHLVKPHIFVLRIHVIYKLPNRFDSIVLVTDTLEGKSW